jgi:leader peptidase (prepilin peptidase)/N-methyltransferase
MGGIVVGISCSLLLPQLHGQQHFMAGMAQSLVGVSVGAGLLYFILRAGRVAFGRQRLRFAGDARIVFTDSALILPDRAIAFDDLFHRKSDTLLVHARRAVMAGITYQDVPIRLTRDTLRVGTDEFVSKEITHLEATAGEIALPREAMGLGDVKLMAAIGAFLGWQAVVFSLMVSSLIGSLVGYGLFAARRGQRSDRLPYGPFIAVAAAIWVFAGKEILTFFVY